MIDRDGSSRSLWFSSITARLAALYSLTAFLVLLFVSVGLHWVLSQSLERDEVTALNRELAELRSLLQQPDVNRPLILMEIDPIPSASGSNDDATIFVRVQDAEQTVVFETSGMQTALPRSAFPAPGGEADSQTFARWESPERVPYLITSALGPNVADSGSTTIQAAMDLSSDAALMQNYRRSMLVLLVLAVLLSTGVSVLVARHGIRPLRDIAAVARRIGAERLHERVEPSRWPEELRELAAAFDTMLERLEGSFRQLKWFSADVAHELRTPLNVLMGEAEVALAKSRSEEEYRQVLESALEEYQRLKFLIDNLLFLARAENAQTSVDRARLDVRAELESVASFFEAEAAERGITVSVEGAASLLADPGLLGRAVSNLLTNALHHTPRGGQVTLRAARNNEGAVEIDVRDTGIGIPADEIDQVFNRFYRGHSREQRPRGLGIGLAIVKSIMALHGGTVTLESTVGEGTIVRLSFPSLSRPA